MWTETTIEGFVEYLAGNYTATDDAYTSALNASCKYIENHIGRILTEVERTGLSSLCYVIAYIILERGEVDFLPISIEEALNSYKEATGV